MTRSRKRPRRNTERLPDMPVPPPSRIESEGRPLTFAEGLIIFLVVAVLSVGNLLLLGAGR